MSSDITTVSALRVEITRLMDGEDPTVADVSVATLDRLLSIAQKRIYREVHTRHTEKPFEITVTNNAAAIPSDFEATSELHFGRRPLKPVAPEMLREMLVNGGSGDATFFARTGTAFEFFPAVADGTALQGTYYARLPDLTDANMGTNALFQAADDLFIFAALVESGPFFSAEAATRMPIWAEKYKSIRDALMLNDQRAAYSAGRIQRSASARVIR